MQKFKPSTTNFLLKVQNTVSLLLKGHYFNTYLKVAPTILLFISENVEI